MTKMEMQEQINRARAEFKGTTKQLPPELVTGTGDIGTHFHYGETSLSTAVGERVTRNSRIGNCYRGTIFWK